MSAESAAHSVDHSFSALYQSHHGWLFAWLRKKIGCPFNAADLAQDTFVRLLGTPLEALREPRAYLFTVARGLMVNHLRRRDLERAANADAVGFDRF